MNKDKEELILELQELYRQIIHVSSQLWETNQITKSGSWAIIAKNESSLRIQEIVNLDFKKKIVFSSELRDLREFANDILDRANLLLEEDLQQIGKEKLL